MIKARQLSQFSKKEIDYLFEHAKQVLNKEGLKILQAPSQKEFGRILIITSRKVGNAPTRNKLRRRLKSIFYENELFKNKFDYAILVKKEATNLSFDQLKTLMLKAAQ